MNRKSEQILKADKSGRVWTPRDAGVEVRGANRIEVFDVCVVGAPAAQAARLFRCRAGTSWGACGVEVGGGCAGASQASPAVRALVVHLPGGARMEVADASQMALAAGLLRALVAGGAGC